VRIFSLPSSIRTDKVSVAPAPDRQTGIFGAEGTNGLPQKDFATSGVKNIATCLRRRSAVTTGFAVLKYGMNAGKIKAWQKNE